MRLDELVSNLSVSEVVGAIDGELASVTSDSRQVSRGSLFVAIPGTVHDGHSFIREALARGAGCLIVERWPLELEHPSIPVVVVQNSRKALAFAAAAIYGHPTHDMDVIGITGTNGKTTSTYIVESIIAISGGRAGVIGTVAARHGDWVRQSSHTTPGPVTLQWLLREMADAGTTHVVMEVSSHALDQYRVDGCSFRVGAFTNLSRDHLDYHSDLESYFQCKARLFHEILSVRGGACAVINVDDSWGARLAAGLVGEVLCVSRSGNPQAALRVVDARFGLDGTVALVATPGGMVELRIPLLGEFNLENGLISAGIAHALGLPWETIERGIGASPQVPGRLERIENRRGVLVLVDYAHTPDALERVLNTLRDLGASRLLTVFGCGGDRDRGKRPTMGRIAAMMSDIVVATSDNPRSEDPSQIISEILPGLEAGGMEPWTPYSRKGYLVEVDRAAAVARVAELAEPGDVVLIAGKGHEAFQESKEGRVPFDDRLVARKAFG